MNDFETMEEMFADSMIKEPKQEPELIQSDGDVKFEDGPYEEEPLPVEVEEEPVEVPDGYYGSKASQVLQGEIDEGFREEFRNYFDEVFHHLDYFEDFVAYVSSMQDINKRNTLLELSKGSRNNLSKQKELWFSLMTPFSAHGNAMMIQAAINAMRTELGLSTDKFSGTLQKWQIDMETPLRKVTNKVNEVVKAINATEETAVEVVQATGKVEIAKIQAVFDKIIEKEVASSKGRSGQLQQEYDLLEKKIEFLEKQIESLIATTKAGVLKERQISSEEYKKHAIDVLGAAADSVAEEAIGKINSITAKAIAIGVGCGFGGVWLFAVVAKHFPGIVF